MRWAIGPLPTSIEPETLQRALELADRAILLNPYYMTRGYILHWLYRRDDAREDVKKALIQSEPIRRPNWPHDDANGTGARSVGLLPECLAVRSFSAEYPSQLAGNSFYLLSRFAEAFAR